MAYRYHTDSWLILGGGSKWSTIFSGNERFKKNWSVTHFFFSWQVEYLLLDPSCSGSGIISRLDHLVDGEDESKLQWVWELKYTDHLTDEGSNDKNGSTQEERLKNLSEFQISVIEHALKCKYILHKQDNVSLLYWIVPNAKRVVYSTCSVHAEENEHVVKTVLKNNPEFELASRDTVLPTWHRRGMPEEMDGDEGNSWHYIIHTFFFI